MERLGAADEQPTPGETGMQSDLRIIVIADSPRDHPLAGGEGRVGMRPVRCACSVSGALRELVAVPADVVVLDKDLPLPDWLRAQQALHEQYPHLPLLVISPHTDSTRVLLAIAAGADGYLERGVSAAEMIDAIRELKAGGAPLSREVAGHLVSALHRHGPLLPECGGLSDREHVLLQLLCDGHSYKSAAAELGVAMDTIRFHIRNIYQKLHVHSKAEAVSTALRTGLVS